jgi:hypothetical protein
VVCDLDPQGHPGFTTLCEKKWLLNNGSHLALFKIVSWSRGRFNLVVDRRFLLPRMQAFRLYLKVS